MARRKNTETLKYGMDASLKRAKELIPAKDSELYPLVREDAVHYGNNFEKYVELLTEREKCTSRALVNSDQFQLVEVNEKMYEKMKEAGYPLDILDDTMGVGMVMKIGRELYPIGYAGDSTLKRLANANWEMVPPSIKAMVYNYALGTRGIKTTSERGNGKDYVVVAQEGKILGVMSKVYTPYPPVDVATLVESAVKETYGTEVECVSTYFDHTKYEMEFQLTGEEARNMAVVMCDQLETRAKRLGVAFNKDEVKPTFGFVARTGETGNDTVSIRAKMSTNGPSLGGLMVGNDINIYHKGKKDIASIISKRIGDLFATFQDVINKLIVAADIKVLDWRSCIVNLATYAKIPDDVWKKMVIRFAEQHPNVDVVTGFDILSAFMDSSGIYMEVNPNATEQMRDIYNVKVDVVMNCNIADYDNNEAAVRKELAEQDIRYPEIVLEGAAKELKIPVNVVKKLRENMATTMSIYAMTHSGEEKPFKALDIYELITGSSVYMKQWYEKKNLSADEVEEKMAAYGKVLAKAKNVCYVVYDKEIS